MKVILLKEVKGRGGEGDVITLKDGYANNYLLKEGYAIKATKGNLKQLEQRKANILKREEVRLAEAKEKQEKLDGLKFKVDAQIGDEGQLFGAITSQMIADGIKKETGIDIDKRRIDIRKAIRSVGLHKAEVTVYRDIKAILDIVVGAESAEEYFKQQEKQKKKQKKVKREQKQQKNSNKEEEKTNAEEKINEEKGNTEEKKETKENESTKEKEEKE